MDTGTCREDARIKNHLCTLVCKSSTSISNLVLSNSARATSTMLISRLMLGRTSRMAARSRRLHLFLATALPTFLLAIMPTGMLKDEPCADSS